MKNKFWSYFSAWAVVLVVFNVIAFVTPAIPGQEKYTASFWIGYVLISLCFVGQLVCAWLALKENNRTKLFYKLPLVTISCSGLIVSFFVGAACMLITALPYWVGVIVCTFLLAWMAIALIKAGTAADIVAQIDEKVKVQTFFVKSLTVDAESLMARAKTDEAKKACKKVYEAVRYSDPMSNDVLAGIESQITLKFAAFSDAVTGGTENMDALAEEVVILISDRNNKCSFLK